MGTDDTSSDATTETSAVVPTTTEIQEIAEEAIAHVRTVERRLLGLHVRGRVGERVDAALVRRGYQGRGR